MAELQKNLVTSTTEPGKQQLRVETEITMSGTVGTETVSKTITFDNPFSEAPTVIAQGVELDAEAGVVAVVATATTVKLSLSQVQASGMTAAAKTCYVVLEGKIA